MAAIGHANMLLNMQENLTAKEMPPSWMWPLPWEMETWMDQITAERNQRYGIKDEDGDNDFGGYENELVDAWIAGASGDVEPVVVSARG